MEAAQMSIDRWIDTEIVMHIDNGMLLSFQRKNIFESVLMRWMNLEPIGPSEVSQKEKDKYCILAHVYVIWRDSVMSLFTGQAWRRRQRTDLGTQCGRKRVGQIERVARKKYITICKTDSQWGSALWQPRGVGWGWKWERGPRREGHIYTCDWLMLMYGRSLRNIIK